MLKSIINFFRGPAPVQPVYSLPFEPGDQQRNLVAETLQNVDSGVKVSTFTGAAGTGKTTCLKLFIKCLQAAGVSYTVAAPTWKAAQRARECLDGEDVRTVHSVTYAGAVEIHQVDEETGEVEEFGDELQFNEREPGTADVGRVLIIDEASMVGKDVSQALLQAIPPSTQIVAVGDPHQLPPVEAEAGFPLQDNPNELTEVFRQAEGSPVLKAATMIREEKVPFTYSAIADYQRGQKILDEAGVQSKWMDANEAGLALAAMIRRNDGDAVGIVGTHKTRVTLNDATRAHLGLAPRRKGPQVGERLICRATGNGLYNSDMVTVTEVKLVNFGKNFGEGWVMKVQTADGRKPREVAVLRKTWECEDCKNRGLIPYSVKKEMDAYVEQDMARHGERIKRDVNVKVEGWMEKHDEMAPQWLLEIWEAQAAREIGAYALYLRKYLVSLDSGYAITCHQSQGSQYQEVLIVADMVDFIADQQKKDVYRWSYTALTRAVSNALVVKKSKNGWER